MKHIELQRVAPADIEARSMELIGQELGERVFPAEQLPVVKRVIHTTADFEYADSLVFSAGAVEAGVAGHTAGLHHRHRHPDGLLRGEQAGAGEIRRPGGVLHVRPGRGR